MYINFKKVILHNFLSYAHSEVDLQDKNYCLVNGINKCKKDNSLSNGSGKSSIFSAICWALTGETIQGITKNLKNEYIEEDSCYVTLFFDVNNDNYEITRYYKPKSDLKIKLNDIDKSGKGIKESELVMANYLPDLTKDLIASVIIVGQGMPNKLSRFTPSGRKQLLEKLSKSDFMIEDIKNRIVNRQNKLNTDKRDLEDICLKISTQIQLFTQQLEQINTKLINLPDVKVIKEKLELIEKELPIDNINKESLDKTLTNLDNLYKQLQEQLILFTNQLNEELQNETNCFLEASEPVLDERSKVNGEANALLNEINRLKNVKDICPTCGQKLPNVVKMDTTQQEQQYKELVEKINQLDKRISIMREKHNQNQVDIKNEFSVNINNKKEEQQKMLNTISTNNSQLRTLLESISNKEKEQQRLQNEFDNHNKYVDDLNNNKKELETNIEVHNNKLKDKEKNKTLLQEHIDVIKKMDTLVKRDFRGYLLSNVIDYINNKCKEYSQIVFETDELDFKLDGNDIDISYCGKPMENLSGGEQQRVDIILQLALRDMMVKYLNFSSNILVLDEIFDNLDALATEKVLQLINSELQDVNSLFIISHHSNELELEYDTEIQIIKNENGISEVV